MSGPQNPGFQTQGARRLKNAQDRLGVAIERLDAALDQDDDRAQGVEIKALQSENTVLKEALGQASTRLDKVIEQLKTRHNA